MPPTLATKSNQRKPIQRRNQPRPTFPEKNRDNTFDDRRKYCRDFFGREGAREGVLSGGCVDFYPSHLFLPLCSSAFRQLVILCQTLFSLFMSSPILVVGSFVQDLTFSTARFPSPGETVVGKFLTGPGGKGSNQAVAARRAGAEVVFVGAVGDDSFAADARKFQEAEGIDARLAIYPDAATGTAAILFDDSGENEIVVALGANEEIRPSDIPDGLLEDAEAVVCQLECNLDTVLDLLKRAGRAGKTRILNPAPLRDDLTGALIQQTDILIPNESEFAAIARLKEIDLPENVDLPDLEPKDLDTLCRQIGPKVVIVTLGNRGVHLSQPDGFERIKAVPGIKVLDTTGAGDAFVGAFSAALQRYPEDLVRACDFANRAAALSVTRPGTAPAMAHLAEIES